MNVYGYPSLSGATLPDKEVERIKEELWDTDITGLTVAMVQSGTHYPSETEHGGIHPSGTQVERNCVATEVQAYVKQRDERGGNHAPVYLIIWAGGYAKGAVYHCGWQFPHMRKYEPEALDEKTAEIYEWFTRILYGEREIPSDVAEFYLE